MGFFDRLFGKPHPSDSWEAQERLELVFDLHRHALCNVGIGDPIEWLSVLGPPEERKALAEGCYGYPSRGVEIWADDGIVKDFMIVVGSDVTLPGFEPFRGTLVSDGRHLGLSSSSTEKEFAHTFGEPYWRDEDDMEIILFYEWKNDIEWQVEFTPGGLLKVFRATTPPLMSTQDQRNAYKVTKEWPPRNLREPLS